MRHTCVALVMLALMLATIVCYVQADFGFPLPPEQPDKFTSKQQLMEYWDKVTEYYNVIGRPKFGRSLKKSVNELQISSGAVPANIVLKILDRNHDGFISKEEIQYFVNMLSM